MPLPMLLVIAVSTPSIEDCGRALEAFQTLHQVLGRRMPTNLRGLAGEVMIWKRLREHQIGFTVKGGQSKCDILLDNRSRVEVRTSAIVSRPRDKTRGWGWPLQKKSDREEVKYDFIVCVALGDDLSIEKAQFYALSHSEAMKAKDVEIRRYPNMKKKLWLYESMDMFFAQRELHPEYFNNWEEGINRNKEQYLLDDTQILKMTALK